MLDSELIERAKQIYYNLINLANQFGPIQATSEINKGEIETTKVGAPYARISRKGCSTKYQTPHLKNVFFL